MGTKDPKCPSEDVNEDAEGQELMNREIVVRGEQRPEEDGNEGKKDGKEKE